MDFWGFWSLENTVNEVDQERHRRKSEAKRAEAHENIDRLLAAQMIVQRRISNSAHHPVQTKIMHGKEGEIEEDERRHKMNLTPELIHHAAEHFGKPKINATESAEQTRSEQDIMNVRNDEIGIVDEYIDRCGSHENAAEAADYEHRHKCQRKTHWGLESNRTTIHRSNPVEGFDSGRNSNHHGR